MLKYEKCAPGQLFAMNRIKKNDAAKEAPRGLVRKGKKIDICLLLSDFGGEREMCARVCNRQSDKL